jgi:hypothetical protein
VGSLTPNRTTRRFPVLDRPDQPRGRPYCASREHAVTHIALPTARRGEVRVRVVASGLEYTDVLIRSHPLPTNDAASHPSCWAMMSSGKSINSAMTCAAFSLATGWPT